MPDPHRAFRTLDLVVRRRLDGLLQGDRAGHRLGPGTDPEEVVRYRPGEDDVRRMDWNVTARTGEAHVWRPLAEHELEAWVLLDESPSMAFGTASMEKGQLGAWAGAAVALMTEAPGNRVGVARLRPGGITVSRPGPGRLVARRILQGAATIPRDGTERGMPTLALGLATLERRALRRGLRVVVSDFIEPDGRSARPYPWEPALRRLAARNDVIVVEVLDPRELDLPDMGLLVLRDPETGRAHEVITSPRLRARFAEAAAGHRVALAHAFRGIGVGHVQVRTDTDWVRDLAHFVRARRDLPRALPRRIR